MTEGAQSDAPVSFFVPGTALPAGSKRAFIVRDKATGRPRPVVTDTSGASGKRWRAAIQLAAGTARPNGPLTGPLSVVGTFILPRPRAHYAASGKLRMGAPIVSEVRPDLDKLGRMLLDALTGVVWRDDAQVARLHLMKRYAGPNDTVGVQVSVMPL